MNEIELGSTVKIEAVRNGDNSYYVGKEGKVTGMNTDGCYVVVVDTGEVGGTVEATSVSFVSAPVRAAETEPVEMAVPPIPAQEETPEAVTPAEEPASEPEAAAPAEDQGGVEAPEEEAKPEAEPAKPSRNERRRQQRQEAAQAKKDQK